MKKEEERDEGEEGEKVGRERDEKYKKIWKEKDTNEVQQEIKKLNQEEE